jgi:hypothetical protein
MKKQKQRLLILFSGLAVLSTPCLGQAGRAELFGTIQDSSGLAVSKAKVGAEDQATMVRYSALSNERGEYHILGMPAGQYVFTVEQPGFRLYRQSGITLRLADRIALDVKLEVGQVSQSVEVTDRKRRSKLKRRREEDRYATARRTQLHSIIDARARRCVARRRLPFGPDQWQSAANQ